MDIKILRIEANPRIDTVEQDNLEKAIAMLESGKSDSEVLIMFPNNSELVKELNVIKNIGLIKSIVPDSNFKTKLRATLTNLPLAKPKFNIVEFLQHNLKIILPVAISTAVFLLIFIKNDLQNTRQLKTTASLPPVVKTSDIQTAVDGIISDYTSDSQITSQGDSDITNIQKTYSTFNLSDLNETTY